MLLSPFLFLSEVRCSLSLFWSVWILTYLGRVLGLLHSISALFYFSKISALQFPNHEYKNSLCSFSQLSVLLLFYGDRQTRFLYCDLICTANTKKFVCCKKCKWLNFTRNLLTSLMLNTVALLVFWIKVTWYITETLELTIQTRLALK